MADLVVKNKCNSPLRTSLDSFLSFTFPLWGVVSPIVILGNFLSSLAFLISLDFTKCSESVGFATAAVCYSLASLGGKRLIKADALIVDKQGIQLPFFLGNGINFTRRILWDQVAKISATTNSDLGKAKLLINRKKGGAVALPVSALTNDLSEQLILATQMWAPEAKDESLDEMQNKLRIGANKDSSASFTELWEAELGHRFCPTSYIPLEIGRGLRNGSLKVVSHLSSGGLSALYLCQLDGSKLVVLKEAVIPEESAENVREKAKQMFDREASLLMKLDNPGIVHVLDSFSEAGRNYLLLEFVNGMDLRQVVAQNGPQKEMDVLEWAVQVAVALKYLHEREQPVIHRDLTPDNIVLRNDGKVIIVDFGAANELIGTATGTFVGKHAFIAPEQLRGKATTLSDIYSFGCTLHFLLTGAEPEALLPSNPKELVPEISTELAELVESCTQLEGSDRYQSFAQLIPVLRRLSAQSMVS